VVQSAVTGRPLFKVERYVKGYRRLEKGKT